MKLQNKPFAGNHRTGAMLPLIAVTMVVLFVACTFAIDIARIHSTRAELRTATDAAARAAVENLSREQSQASATQAAINVARLNRVAGNGLDLIPENIRFGTNTPNPDGSFTFTESSTFINAVRVIGERSARTPDGPVNMMFGPLFGKENYEPVAAATATRLDRDIALVLDKSGSMVTAGRFPALLSGVDTFLSEFEASIPQERVSLTVYDTNPQKLVDMTDDLQSIRDAILTQTPGGLTGIGQGLEVGIDSIQNDPGVRGVFSLKSIVVMTDGRQNRGVGPEIVAQRAAAQGITVHTITFSSGANQTLMKTVAESTGGIHIHANSNQDLIDAFGVLARTIQVIMTE